jgi:uncharacterized protein (DUF885 family)
MKPALAAVLILLAAAMSPAAGADAEFDDTVRRFAADQQTVSRAFDLPWSARLLERREALLSDWTRQLAAAPFDELGQHGRIDFVLLRNEVAANRNQLDLQRRRLAEMDELLSFRGTIQDLEAARWQMKPVDAQAAASALAGIPDQVKKIRERIEKGRKAKDDPKAGTEKAASPAPLKVSPSLARRTAGAAGEVRGTLKSWFAFHDGFQPEFSWWVKKPYDEAAAALESYAKFLREEVAELKGKDEDPLVGDPIGRDALVRDLETEFLACTPEELIRIGEKEFAWCEAEMRKAANEMGFDDWHAAMAKVKGDFMPPGRQFEMVAQSAREATEFVRSRRLVTIPPLCEEVWRLTMLSPEAQKSLPYVAYGGGSILVAYAKDEMKHEDKLMAMRGNNRHFTRITTAHELIPGHHLQSFNAARHREYRRLFSTPFFVEGWALYWEMRLWELGFARTPEERIGMLFWRMHRCARIIVSLKFHLGQMQPKEMVEFLVGRVGHERLGATSEVRRFIEGSYAPLYQCGYMIGGLQLRALHREAVTTGKMSELQFHDTVLTLGPIPMELVRAGILNLPLSRDTRAAWKFAE